MTRDPLFILAVLAACVVASEVLARRTPLRHLGTALIVILVTGVVANLGIIPTGAEPVPLYSALFREVAWLAIFWLLLQVNLRAVLGAGGSMIALFVVGSFGTALGAMVGMWVIDGASRIGPTYNVVAGMFTGTYTGGSTNFIAIASHYKMTDGVTLLAANAVDATLTTVWMAVTLFLPRLLGRQRAASTATAAPLSGIAEDTETVHPLDLGILVAAGAGVVWLSEQVEAWSAAALPFQIPGILVLTTVSLALAQIPAVARLRGAKLLGMFGVYLFLAVIGALCDVHVLAGSGALGLAILVFACVLLLVHGTILFGVSTVLRIDPQLAAVASQANVGGGTSALALARSLGRGDLVLPGILVGSLGNALGTYLGLAVTGLLPGG